MTGRQRFPVGASHVTARSRQWTANASAEAVSPSCANFRTLRFQLDCVLAQPAGMSHDPTHLDVWDHGSACERIRTG